MMHLLRPEWCWAYLPLLILLLFVIKRFDPARELSSICDPHLIPHVIKSSGPYSYRWALFAALLSATLMIFSGAGPTWSRWPVSAMAVEHPRVILLDLSSSMLENDISPDRLSRAKLIIHDLLHLPGPWGLIVYTSEPFVLSPLTQDGSTMSEWVDTLKPSIMPVTGCRLDRALHKAAELMSEAGFEQGDVLVLTDKSPDTAAISLAHVLANGGLRVSILPFIASKDVPAAYSKFSQQGHGQLINYKYNKKMLADWLDQSTSAHAAHGTADINVSVWQDRGRWFLIPALLLLLPLFQRGAKHRIFR